jgi:putative transcriptional regulator
VLKCILGVCILGAYFVSFSFFGGVMLDVPVDLLVKARVNSCLSVKASAALVHATPRNWYAWEDGRAKMPPAIFELFLVKTGQKVLKVWPRAAGILEPRSSPPSPAGIKLGRNAAGLTQSQAAQLVHVTPGAWQKWELGKARMRPAIFELFMLKTGWSSWAGVVGWAGVAEPE